MKKLVAVFGPGDVREDDALYHEARRLGTLLAQNHFVTLTGGYGGVMEAASRGAREAGGSSVGVTAEVYAARGREPNEYVTKVISVKSANDRLMELIDLADAYITIGNSTGTLLEVMTAWDYMIKRFIPIKPILLVGGAWSAFYEYVCRTEHFLEVNRIAYVPNANAATEHIISIFGAQHNFPELNVVQ